jgi:hypothetical protein
MARRRTSLQSAVFTSGTPSIATIGPLTATREVDCTSSGGGTSLISATNDGLTAAIYNADLQRGAFDNHDCARFAFDCGRHDAAVCRHLQLFRWVKQDLRSSYVVKHQHGNGHDFEHGAC